MSVSALVEPAYRTAPEFTKTLGDEVSDLADLAGFEPDPEQRLGLDLIFALDHRGASAAFEFAVICSRQNLKTGLFKQAVLGWLFLTDQQLVVWSAHEFRTAKEAHRDMANLIEGCPYLDRRVKKVYYGAGEESIELLTGQRLIFKARTLSGGRGLTGDKVVLDEAFKVRAEHMGALLPTLSVRPDPQILYGSSAGMSSSQILRGIRDRGREGTSDRLAYLEWCAPMGGCENEPCLHRLGSVGCALDNTENWQRANPLLGRERANGTGLSMEYVKAERDAMPAEEFARERLGWWDEPGAADIFGRDNWESCSADPIGGLSMGAFGVAVTRDLTHSAIVAAALDDEGNTHLRPLQHGPGTAWVVERAAEIQAEHDVDAVIDGRGPGAVLIPNLEEKVHLRVLTTNDFLDSCAHLYELVREHRLRHADYAELNEAVSGATTRSVGDRWAWGRKDSTADISPLEAGTIAAWAVGRPSKPTVSAYDSGSRLEVL